MTKPEINTSYLYIMGYPEGGPVKIGQSMDTARRTKDLVREGHKNIVVTGKWPVGRMVALAAERYAQWLLRDYHFRGEWFNVDGPTAQAAIEKAVAAVHDRWHAVPPIDTGTRKIVHGEYVRSKHERGTSEAIHAVLDEGETHSDLIREAVKREIKRRSATGGSSNSR